jgi:hypothetical protein
MVMWAPGAGNCASIWSVCGLGNYSVREFVFIPAPQTKILIERDPLFTDPVVAKRPDW